MPAEGPLEPPPTEGAIIIGDGANEAKEALAKRTGIICSACGQPMNADGWEYVTLRTEHREGEGTAVLGRAFICGRQVCTEPRAEMEKVAAARRPARPWHVFDGSEPVEQQPDTPA